jgi:inhibitor of cysteine peptidase
MAEIVIKQENNGSTVSAKVGDSLSVELPENPTTGFRWAPAELDARIVELRTDEFILGSDTAVGAGGVRVFRFLVKGPGSACLQLKLVRAWESGASSKLFEIHINVG